MLKLSIVTVSVLGGERGEVSRKSSSDNSSSGPTVTGIALSGRNWKKNEKNSGIRVSSKVNSVLLLATFCDY